MEVLLEEGPMFPRPSRRCNPARGHAESLGPEGEALPRRIATLALLALAGCAPYALKPELSYDRSLGADGTFDLYEPTGGGDRRPAIVAIHGGAWQSGDKVFAQGFAEEMCPEGYVVLSINYRLAPQHKWPTQLKDCQAALRWFRANADALRIDPSRIAAFGVSAGGHLATMLALRDDPQVPGGGRVVAAVDADGDSDMSIPDGIDNHIPILTAVLGEPPRPEERIRDISTVTFARPDASVLIIHGTGDTNVHYVHAERLHEVLKAAGADVKLIPVDDACHGNCWKRGEANAALHAFLASALKK